MQSARLSNISTTETARAAVFCSTQLSLGQEGKRPLCQSPLSPVMCE